MAIRLLLNSFPPGTNRIRKLLQNVHSGVPVNASVGNTDSLLQALWPFRWNGLLPLMNIRLDHHPHDSRFAIAELVTNCLRDFWLVTVVFV